MSDWPWKDYQQPQHALFWSLYYPSRLPFRFSSFLLILYHTSCCLLPWLRPIATEREGLDLSFCLPMFFFWKEVKIERMDEFTAQGRVHEWKICMQLFCTSTLLHFLLPIQHFFPIQHTLVRLLYFLSLCMCSNRKGIIVNWREGFEPRQRHEQAKNREKR